MYLLNNLFGPVKCGHLNVSKDIFARFHPPFDKKPADFLSTADT